jgi:hypothetical protein
MAPAINHGRFQKEIAWRILRDQHSHDDITNFLQGEGGVISWNTLKARLKQ